MHAAKVTTEMRTGLSFLTRALMLLTLSLAFASSGFAHRMSGPELSPDLMDFLASGGTLADICEDHEGGAHGGSPDCEACRLVTGSDLAPASITVVPAWFASSRLDPRPLIQRAESTQRDPVRSVRAPPLLLS